MGFVIFCICWDWLNTASFDFLVLGSVGRGSNIELDQVVFSVEQCFLVISALPQPEHVPVSAA